MIINQTIKNGFTIVNKTGAYFSLISAGGVVNVRLSEKGRTVLDTKMWVGMSIDKAIPFDEITIKGDDGAVEFWAGDVSMSQARFSNDAAKAIKASSTYVEGGKQVQITDSNYLRKAVRIRPNKDILIGGASMQAWEAKAGETIEIPVAGTLYAYKYPASASMENAVIESTEENLWFDSRRLDVAVHVSDDGMIKICGDVYSLKIQNLNISAEWKSIFYHSTAARKMFYSSAENRLFVVLMDIDGYTRLEVSEDDGITWKLLYGQWMPTLAGRSSLTVTNTHAVLICTNNNGKNCLRVIDIKNAKAFDVETEKFSLGNFTFVSWMENNVIARVIGENAGVYHSSDNASTFNKVDDLTISHKIITTDQGKVLFGNGSFYGSHDLTAEFKQLQTTSYFPQYDHLGVREIGGILSYVKSGYLRYINYNDDIPTISSAVESSLLASSGEGVSILTSNGKAYLSMQTISSSVNGEIIKYDVIGDARPARVEVMELLS